MNRHMASASLLLFLIFLGVSFAPAQRVNDKDIEIMMDNLKSDAGRFRSAFDDSVKKSTIRHTSKEKDAKNLVKRFEDDTKGMLNTFKSHKKADTQLATVISTGNQIDQVLREATFDDKTNAAWDKVRVELGQLADAYGVPGLVGAQPR
jgi:hypothetical protein